MAASPSRLFRYDVFLSFRGADTRSTFTSHLHRSLKDRGINTFMDEDELERGEDISSALRQAIRDSRILLVVFSKNYAESRWCLQELEKIMDCSKSFRGQIVLPVFYDVNPSDVRKQKGSYGEAFVKHGEKMVSEEGKVAVARWRDALTEAGNLSGWDLTNSAHRVEAKIVSNIVYKIWNELKHTHLDIAKYPVGLDSRLERINKHIDAGFDGVRFIGVCGMGGIGKTTLAKAVYNQFFHNFEAKTFLANVREQSAEPNGLLHLQEQLLRDLLRLKKMIELGNVHRGVNVIKDRISNRRVLVVLDDVSHPDQLNALARDSKWFGPGSRIVITTRDKDLLKQIKVDYIYMVEELNGEEALQLFNHHAFGDCGPKEEFTNLAKDVLSYCKGLPLALEVLGSFLLDRSIAEWTSALEKLHRIPHNDILKQLRISFDALSDDNDNDKDLFLDIAFFFVGQNKDYATKILNGCNFSAEIGISVLTKRCLLEINKFHELTMHDLLRDMGREIVRLESPKNPGNRSRLWSQVDILTSLNNHLGTEQVEGLVLELPAANGFKVSIEAFTKMSRLRLLKLKNVYFQGQYGVLSSELRWLHWHGFPLDFIPNEFHMENLVALDMQYNKLRVPWKVTKFLWNLKVLNLSYSSFLTRTPDFMKMPNLEELILESCFQLKNVHDSIGHLKALVSLNLRYCINLQNLPNSICRVKSLQILNISDCKQISMLPDDLGSMESLKEINATRTSIKQVPLSIAQLKNLTSFSLSGCKYESRSYSSISALWSWIKPAASELPKGNCQLMTSLSGLTSLKGLSLKRCNLSDDSIPVSIRNLQSLGSLDLSENNFCHFPGAFRFLSNIRTLLLRNCLELTSILELPPKIHHLDASHCTSLERISMPGDSTGSEIILSNCPNLAEFSGLDKWNADYAVMLMEGCKNLHAKYTELDDKNGQSHEHPLLEFGSAEPEWSDFSSSGSLVTFQMPACQGCKVNVITICVVYEYNNIYDDYVDGTYPEVTRPDETTESNCIHHLVLGSGPKDHMALIRFSPEIFSGGREYKNILLELDADWGVYGAVKRFGVNFQKERCAHCLSSLSGVSDTVDVTSINFQEMAPSELDTASSSQHMEVSSKRGTDDAETSPCRGQTKRIRHWSAIEMNSSVSENTGEAESSADSDLKQQ